MPSPSDFAGKRSPRGSASSFILALLRWLNYSIVAASLLAIIFMFALRIIPTAWGWGFLSFSFLTVLCAIVGCICTSPTARRMCYGVHVFLLISSTTVQGSVFLLFISKPDSVLSHLQSNRSDYDGRILLKVDAALLLWVFCVQLVILAMSCLVHYCQPVDYYVDLEGNNKTLTTGPLRRGSRRLSRVQEVTLTDAETERHKELDEECKQDSEASRLHRAMKEKYSKEDKSDDLEV